MPVWATGFPIECQSFSRAQKCRQAPIYAQQTVGPCRKKYNPSTETFINQFNTCPEGFDI